MKPFYLEDGILKIGEPIIRGALHVDNHVEDYNIINVQNQHIVDTQEEQESCIVDITNKRKQFNNMMDMQLKQTKDYKYCAVYSPNHLHCDFYEQVEPEKYTLINGDPNNPEVVDRAIAEYRFCLKRNTYRCGEFIVEFVTHPTTGETLILFNDTHSQLSVYNTKGQILHKEKADDKFFSRLKVLNDKYMIMQGWIWHPIQIEQLYNLHELVTTPNYSPLTIWREEDDIICELIDNNTKFRFCQLNTYSYSNEFDEKYHKIIKEYTCSLDEAYNDYRYIIQSVTPVKEYWYRDNLIKKIFNRKQYANTNITIQPDAYDKIKIIHTLTPDKRLFIECSNKCDNRSMDIVGRRIIELEDSDNLPKSITIARFFHLIDNCEYPDLDISLVFHYEQIKLTCDMNMKMINKKYDPDCILDINIY